MTNKVKERKKNIVSEGLLKFFAESPITCHTSELVARAKMTQVTLKNLRRDQNHFSF